MNRQLATLLLLLCISLYAMPQDSAVPRKKAYPGGKCYMMRVTLRDKQANRCSLQNPQDFLSQKAIQRRRRQGIEVDSTDLPVSDAYIIGLQQCGMEIVTKSKWNNTVVVKAKSMSAFKQVARLPYVTQTRLVWISPDSIAPAEGRLTMRKELRGWGMESTSTYGVAYAQIHALNGESLHRRNFMGDGMTIAVLDGGFMNVDRIPAFSTVKIAGTADVVNPDKKTMFRNVDHGTKVLSTMALNVEERYVGTAPNAAYWLIRCEDNESEQLVEEDYWAAAAEIADSVGADIITSSLGYSEFDHKTMSHRYAELDGMTSVCSRAASMLASKGIVMVSSAGNEGMGSWKKINVPADARDIITVGAVTPARKNAAFSSIGPSADNRTKPDVMAYGSPAAVVTGRGSLLNDMGTSFAAPQVAGLIACLWQAHPEKTAKQIVDTVRKAADNYNTPDNIYGFGIPDFSKAMNAR